MDFGIDTVTTHLDLINWPTYTAWSGGSTPTFAGRNFIGGDYLWGRAEATNAKIHPHPEDPTLLDLVGPSLIAPMQGMQTDRQQFTGLRGFLAGALDAQALCRRIVSGLTATEFSMPDLGVVNLWLTVDPRAPFSADYWAGWANYVNQYPATGIPGTSAPQPFYASIICQYAQDAKKILQPDPHVTAAVAVNAPGKNTRLFAYWADAPDPNHDGLPPNPQINWTGTFDPTTTPLIWRVGKGVGDAGGTPTDQDYCVDAIIPPLPLIPPITAFMLTANKWQPTIPGILNIGISASLVDPPPADQVTDAQVTCLQLTPLPEMPDVLNNSLMFPSISVSTVGRYIEQTDAHGKTHSVNAAEVLRLNNANIAMFSVWERGAPNTTAYFDPAQDRGTTDGHDAFFDCGVSLQQPPQTPVFFAVDYDAGDPDPVQGGGPNAKNYISQYFAKVALARDAFAQQHPDRYFLIGVYAAGAVLEWLYELGHVSYFWQSPSTGTAGNQPPNHPWYHANRWQFRAVDASHPMPGNWNCVPGADPDTDWGDGGSWFLTDDLNQQLINAQATAVFYGWDVLDPP